MRLAMWTGVLLASVCSAAGAKEAAKPVTFTTSARVEVDADGKLVKVEAAQDLPEPVRAYVERQIAQWKFAPNVREGVSGNSTTWIRLGACALPKDDGTYAMGLAFGGNGPRGYENMGLPWETQSFLMRSRMTGRIDVTYVVNPDGSAKMETVEGLGGSGYRRQIQQGLDRWFDQMRFEPETVGGKPVATRIGLVINVLDNPRDSQLPNASVSEECQRAGMATAPGSDAIATDSVVSIVPAI